MPNPQTPSSTLESSTLKCDEKFESVFNNLTDAVFIHDLQGHFLEVLPRLLPRGIKQNGVLTQVFSDL